MYMVKGKQVAMIEPVTFSELNMTENDIEKIPRNNIEHLVYKEEMTKDFGIRASGFYKCYPRQRFWHKA